MTLSTTFWYSRKKWRDDDDDEDVTNSNNKGELLRSLITLEKGVSKTCTMTIKQGQKEDA